MQNKKLYITLIIAGIVVAAAAFVGGRLLNGGVSPLGMFPMGGGNVRSVRIDMTPAPELPKVGPDVQGSFVERKDNTIILQTFPMETGGGGVVISEGPGEGAGSGPVISQSGEQGPKVEVVITNQTVIYRDATEMQPPSEASETMVIQQVVEQGSLDDLTSNSMVMVWGRKNGDRVIADMILYSQPVIFRTDAP